MIDEVNAWEGSTPSGNPPSGSPWLSRLFSLLIAVVGALVLIGLLLPILGRRPGGGRRLQCASNLRQLGLGIEGYQRQYNYYPPGTIANADLPIERRPGWGVTILPYIDQVSYF